MMKKILFILIISCLFSEPVSESFASNIAENFYYSKNDRNQNQFSILEIDTYNVNEELVFYIFHLDSKGFILVSGDSLIAPILGYSFKNQYKSEGIPSNILYLFDSYVEQLNQQKILNVIDDDVMLLWEKYFTPVDYEQESRDVSPLILAQFDQDSYWNSACPEDSQGPGGHALVGCVAVSMAQIMHYWQYPTVGSGSSGYTSNYGYLEADYSASNYNYASMPNTSSNSSETQELLYHCGVSVEMDYGPDGSGAYSLGGNPSSEYALQEYFSYSNEISTHNINDFSESVIILKNELDNGRPFIQRGCDDDGCHAWNIDGYNDSDYFHNNWGWGGWNNGYFLLDYLDGYTSDLKALIHITPDQQMGCMDQTALNYDSDAEMSCSCCCEYDQSEFDCDGEVTIRIRTDQYPAETSWQLLEENNSCPIGESSVMNSSNYIYNTDFCLEDGEYTFSIYDSYGDGICCEYGSGYYRIYLNGDLIHTNSAFTDMDSFSFTVEEFGCTNLNACNYNQNALIDDDSCVYPSGCDNECGSTLEFDCFEQCGGDAVLDCEGVCGGNAEFDCWNICNGNAAYDDCGICNGNNLFMDCLGECFGNAAYDDCGVCEGSGILEGECDCDGNVDLGCGCGEVGPSGCDNACGSTAEIDECDICDDDPSNDCVQDCSGQWGGDSSVDNCGICDSNPNNDCASDCNGEWGGITEDSDSDGVCSDVDSDDNNPYQCSDNDNDTCDDCSSGSYDTSNDGPDYDGDGLCDTEQEEIPGDLNGDSNINVADIVVLVNWILYNIDNDSGDLNNDGNLNVADIVTLIQLIFNSN